MFLLIILQLLLPPAISSTDCEKNYSFQKNCQVYADKNIIAIFINYLKKKSRLSADDFGVGIFLKKILAIMLIFGFSFLKKKSPWITIIKIRQLHLFPIQWLSLGMVVLVVLLFREILKKFYSELGRTASIKYQYFSPSLRLYLPNFKEFQVFNSVGF